MAFCDPLAPVAFIRGTARIQGMDTETAVKDPALMASRTAWGHTRSGWCH
jgi:hypothetical protein